MYTYNYCFITTQIHGLVIRINELENFFYPILKLKVHIYLYMIIFVRLD